MSARTHNPRKPAPARRLAHEAFLSILRTADSLLREVDLILKPAGLSHAQYNILRILRGAGEPGLACREIGARMISRDPDITRLLDKLEARGLLTRERQRADRRVVKTRISETGLGILSELDEPIAALHHRQFQHLGARRQREIVALLGTLERRGAEKAG